MRMIDAETTHRALDFPYLIDALRAAHRAPPAQAEALLLAQPPSRETDGEINTLLCLPSWRAGGPLGVKLATVFPQNARRSGAPPAVQAVYALFDGLTGAPAALIDGGALTYRKTAADSALGAAFLARADARRLLMVGAGGLAPFVIAAHRAARPSLTELRIWNRSPDRAEALAARLAAETPGLDVAATRDLEAAAPRADLISCATNAVAPLIFGAWLAPGAHLDLIGSYTPEMRETDDVALRRGRLYGDGRPRMFADSGEIVGGLARGAIRAEDVLGDLFDLAQGRAPGRRSVDEITLFKNAGGGHLDLMTAEALLRRLDGGGPETRP